MYTPWNGSNIFSVHIKYALNNIWHWHIPTIFIRNRQKRKFVVHSHKKPKHVTNSHLDAKPSLFKSVLVIVSLNTRAGLNLTGVVANVRTTQQSRRHFGFSDEGFGVTVPEIVPHVWACATGARCQWMAGWTCESRVFGVNALPETVRLSRCVR